MSADAHEFSERYELVERIAVGGMAEVFRAKKYGSHGFAKQMAVKRILPNLAASEEFVTRFIAEAKIAVTLSHANIVQVFDFSRFGDSLYIAMEYIDGADLADLLARFLRAGGPISVAPGLHIAMELLKGLDFAHRKKVVHRDISPSNILVSRAGEVKIADFGIAQAAGVELTKRHRVMGKWPYMSPEQTRGEELDVRSDLFSAGTVLYELLTGERLFLGKNASEIVRAIAEREVRPPSQVRTELPTGLDEPILSLLERIPDQRPSAASVLTKLVEVSYESTVQATSASLAGELERVLPKRKSDDTGSTALLDDIISSELSHVRAGASRVTRVTLEAADIGAGEVGEKTAMTFIKTSVGTEGLSEWVVGDNSGTYALKRTDRLYAVGDGAVPDGDGVLGERHTAADVPFDSSRTIIDATSGAARAAAIANASASPRRERRIRPVVISVGIFAAIAALVLVQQGGGGDRGNEAPLVATGDDAATPLAVEADAAAPAPQKRRGRYTSTPTGAEVYIDGERAGTTPLEIDAPDESSVVEFRKDGFETCVGRELAGGEEELSCTLEESAARLTVLSKPSGATVFVAGERVGKTPLKRFRIAARAGSTEVTLKKRGYKTATQRVALRKGSSARVKKDLVAEAESGRVDIYSEPWANVYFRGKKIGVAPVRGLVLPGGKHRLTLVNPVQNRRTTITVTVPGQKRYKVTLPPKK